MKLYARFTVVAFLGVALFTPKDAHSALLSDPDDPRTWQGTAEVI